jgi:hypothetical protein
MILLARIAQLGGIVLIIISCFVLANWVEANQTIAANNPQGINMIQPGRDVENNYANSQSNLNNSQSNLNNSEAQLNLAQATAVLVDAQGDYIVNAARATQIVADSDWGPINVYNAGQKQGAGAAFGLSFVGGVFALVILLLALARFR